MINFISIVVDLILDSINKSLYREYSIIKIC